MARPAALARYREIALPTTTEEAWRTDLEGFDPDALVSNGHDGGQTPDVAKEVAFRGEFVETGVCAPSELSPS